MSTYLRLGLLGVVLLVATGSVSAQTVLCYDVNSTLQNGWQSAIAAGYTTTRAASAGEFTTLLSSQDWDLVSLDVPSSGMDDTVAQAVADYIALEGRVMLCYWNLDSGTPGATLRAAFQVATTVDFTTPLPVYSWDLAHPIWTAPNPIDTIPLPVIGTTWGDDGDLMEPAAGGIPLGGFVDSPTTGQCAIVLGNDGRTILNGFVYDNHDPAVAIPFLQNEMAFLLGGGVGGGPIFSRGDSNSDGVFDISDGVFTLASLFVPGSPASSCADAADSNDDGVVDISDGVYVLAALFVPGAPPPPAPSACGIDPTADALDCGSFPVCP